MEAILLPRLRKRKIARFRQGGRLTRQKTIKKDGLSSPKHKRGGEEDKVQQYDRSAGWQIKDKRGQKAEDDRENGPERRIENS